MIATVNRQSRANEESKTEYVAPRFQDESPPISKNTGFLQGREGKTSKDCRKQVWVLVSEGRVAETRIGTAEKRCRDLWRGSWHVFMPTLFVLRKPCREKTCEGRKYARFFGFGLWKVRQFG